MYKFFIRKEIKNMKVYVVEYFDYDEHIIKGIFTDEKRGMYI